MLKKTISKIMAVTMLVSSIGQISLLNTVSAAEQTSTKDVWIDFENYNSVADVPTDSTGTFYLQTIGTSAAAEVATIDDNKSLKLVNVDSENYNYFKVNFDQEATKTQRVIIEYDMMSFNEPTTEPKAQLKTEIHYNASSLKTAAMIQSSWKNSEFTGSGTAGSASVPVAGTWYHVKHELDIANDTAYTIFTDREAGTKIYEKSVTNFTTYEYLRAIGFHSYSSNGRTSYFDNIKIDYVYDIPSIEATVYAGETAQTDLSAVSADTDSIKVNFNAAMDETTVTSENIYVVNKLTNEAVASSVSYEDKVATVALTNGVQKGATYQLVVTKAVVNPEGIGAGEDTTLDFTVASGIEEDAMAENLTIDFEDFDSISDVPTDKNGAYYLDAVYTDTTQTQAAAEIVNIDGNNVIKLESQGSTNYNQFRVNFDTEASKKAKITVEYDMMSQHEPTGDPKTQLRTEVYYTKGATDGFKVAAIMQSGWHNSEITGNGVTTAGIPVKDRWYHVKHEMDIASSTAYTVFTDKTTGAAIYGPKTVTNFTWADYLRGIGFQCSSSSGRTSFFDNITVTYTYDEPKVTADSVKLYADGVEQTDKTQVAQLTDTLTADFGTAMDVTTLTSESIYVANKATGAKVAAVIDCADGVAELTFGEVLAKNTTYVLYITEGVKSALGSAVSDYTPVEFTVAGDASLPAETVGEDFVVDFEDYTSVSDVPTATSGSYYLLTKGTAAAEVVKTDDNSYIKLPTVDGTNYTQFMINIDSEAAKEAEVVVEYDVMTEVATSAIRSELYNGEGFSVLFYANGSNGWNALNGGQGKTISGVPVVEKWYHVKHVFNIAEQKFSAVYTEKGSEAALHSVSKYSVDANWVRSSVDKITGVGLQCKSTVGTTAFDNVSVTYNYKTPTVTADSISLVNTEGAVQSNWNNVSLLTKAVKIDFGTVMDTSTLTADNVYLENKATGDKIDAVLAYADGVLTLNLAEKLSAESVYKIVISDTVANVDGAVVSDYTPLEFTTGKSTRTAVLTGAYVGSSKVTEFTDLTAGDTLTVNVSYANSTSEAQTVNVLIAYYNGNALDHVELIKTENISASVATMNYTYNHTVADLTDITKVKIFSWDALNNMVPLSESIVLD